MHSAISRVWQYLAMCCTIPLQVLDDAGAPNIKIICKIESQAGLINFDDILAVADGIMVARGDLAMVRGLGCFVSECSAVALVPVGSGWQVWRARCSAMLAYTTP